MSPSNAPGRAAPTARSAAPLGGPSAACRWRRRTATRLRCGTSAARWSGEVVTIDEAGGVTCTCDDRTPHDVWHQHWGWCAHIEKLMRGALRGYRLVSIRHDPEAHGALCAGCRPTCRAYARRLSPL